jgi:hypothetical protein
LPINRVAVTVLDDSPMQQATNVTPPPSDPPHLKLRSPSVDHGEDGMEPSATQPVLVAENSVLVASGAVLPERCVKCGDAMDTLPARTLRGGIHYRLCRDHVVSTVAYILAGLALVTLGAAAIGSKLIGDPIVANRLLPICLLLAAAGAWLVYWALPVVTSRISNGRHQVRRLHAEVVDDLRRMQR